MSTHIEIDPVLSGCSGDMLVSALLGIIEIDADDVLSHITQCIHEVTGFKIDAKISRIESITISGMRIELSGDATPIISEKIEQSLHLLSKYLKHQNSISVMLDAFDIILEGEKNIHDDVNVHLHELGTIDTIFDLFAVAYLIDLIEPTSAHVLPIETGYGKVRTAHGILPVPAPVTQYILEKSQLITLQASVQGEVLTPTGAALLYSISNNFPQSQNIVWTKSNFGFGNKEFGDRINAVRVRLGISSDTRSLVSILETSVDDITGEHLGYAMDVLLDSGALDVSYSAIFMKKNRPGWNIKVIAKYEDTDRIAEILMKNTGTLGIRVYFQSRHISSRSQRKIMTFEGSEVRIKTGKYREKYEFDDLVELSKVTGMSPLELEKKLDEHKKGSTNVSSDNNY